MNTFDCLPFNLPNSAHDPVALSLDTGCPVAKCSRPLGPVEKEHVRVAVAGHAQVGQRPRLLGIRKGLA